MCGLRFYEVAIFYWGFNMRTYDVAVLAGDGIGVDVTDAAFAIIDAVTAHIGGISVKRCDIRAGAGFYSQEGYDIEDGGEERSGQADAIFVGAIGLPSIRWPDGTEIAPHLRLRERFQLYAGVRPVKAYSGTPARLSDARASLIDLVILRESTEGLFYSAAVHNRTHLQSDEEVQEILRITRSTTEKLHDFAFKLARKRARRGGKNLVTCVDKANVFRSMAFFRNIFDEVSTGHQDVRKGYNYVDAQALDLIRQPWEFDVLVMENMFGDILSDLAGGLVGGMGMAACAEIGDNHGLFQPAHGSAPDIMGQDRANPLASILSAALMLDYLADRADCEKTREAAEMIEDLIEKAFDNRALRPMEFGGDMGTKAITNTLLDYVKQGG